MNKMASVVGKLVNPGTYQAAWAGFIADTHVAVRKGSIKPLFYAMTIVGVSGYSMEWYSKGSKSQVLQIGFILLGNMIRLIFFLLRPHILTYSSSLSTPLCSHRYYSLLSAPL
jgi:hypothetical protein